MPGIESRSTETDLSVREAQLLEVQRIARVGTWEWEVQTDRLTWSEGMYSITGVDADFEPSYSAFLEVVHPHDRHRTERAIQHSLASGDDYTVMHRMMPRPGDERLLLCRGTVYRDADGEPERMVGAALDLSDLQPMAEDHRARHDQLLVAEELIGAGSFAWDIEHDRVTWSDGLYRIFGYRPGEFEGTFQAYLEAVHPDDRAERGEILAGLLEEGESNSSRCRIVRPTGEVRVTHSHIRVVRDSDGRATRLVGACLDVTDLLAQ